MNTWYKLDLAEVLSQFNTNADRGLRSTEGGWPSETIVFAEQPFEAERRRMTTVHTIPPIETSMPEALKQVISEFVGDTACIAFTKGSVASFLEVSTQVWGNGQATPIDEQWRQKILASNDQLARVGYVF